MVSRVEYLAQWQRIKAAVEERRGQSIHATRRKPMTDQQFKAAMGLMPAEREIPEPIIREQVLAPPKPQPRPQQPPSSPPQTSGLRSYL